MNYDLEKHKALVHKTNYQLQIIKNIKPLWQKYLNQPNKLQQLKDILETINLHSNKNNNFLYISYNRLIASPIKIHISVKNNQLLIANIINDLQIAYIIAIKVINPLQKANLPNRFKYQTPITVYFKDEELTSQKIADAITMIEERLHKANTKFKLSIYTAKPAASDTPTLNPYCSLTIDRISSEPGQNQYISGSKPEGINKRQQLIADSNIITEVMHILYLRKFCDKNFVKILKLEQTHKFFGVSQVKHKKKLTKIVTQLTNLQSFFSNRVNYHLFQAIPQIDQLETIKNIAKTRLDLLLKDPYTSESNDYQRSIVNENFMCNSK